MSDSTADILRASVERMKLPKRLAAKLDGLQAIAEDQRDRARDILAEVDTEAAQKRFVKARARLRSIEHSTEIIQQAWEGMYSGRTALEHARVLLDDRDAIFERAKCEQQPKSLGWWKMRGWETGNYKVLWALEDYLVELSRRERD